MQRLPTYFRFLLIAMGLIYASRTAVHLATLLGEANGLVHADGFNPVGGDYINQFAAARLVLEGRASEIYATTLFGAFEQTLIGPFEGIGVWVYPPPSLLFVWPFGLVDYVPGLIVWSVIGLAVMAFGAWRAGLRPLELLVLLLAPATISGVVIGQTSNLFLGLLLIAVSARDGGRPAGGVAAGLLTMKPQLGFALPVLFLLRRQWVTIGIAIATTLALAGLSALIFGLDVWRSYLGDSMPFLTEAERTTTGTFMLLEPSVFMAGRILTGDAGTAYLVHAIIAAIGIAYALWRMIGARALDQQAAIALSATALIAPYFHTYDGGLLLCAALLAARQWETGEGPPRLLAYFVVVAAWVMPDLTQIVNGMGLPLGPVILIAVLILAGEAPGAERQRAAQGLPTPKRPNVGR